MKPGGHFIMITLTKDPDETLDYKFDWSDELTPLLDTIDTGDIIVQDGITVGVVTKTTQIVTVWLSGGSSGKKYLVTCKIVTAAGREYDRSFWLKTTTR